MVQERGPAEGATVARCSREMIVGCEGRTEGSTVTQDTEECMVDWDKSAENSKVTQGRKLVEGSNVVQGDQETQVTVGCEVCTGGFAVLQDTGNSAATQDIEGLAVTEGPGHLTVTQHTEGLTAARYSLAEESKVAQGRGLAGASTVV